MRLISLNLECGAKYNSVIDFIKKYSVDTDIFCFQEVFHNTAKIRPVLKNARPNLFLEIQKVLSNFTGYHALPQEDDVGGLAVFLKKPLATIKSENIVIFKDKNTSSDTDQNYFSMGRNLQLIEFICEEKTYSVFNFHGMLIPKNKNDTEKRIEQSNKLKEIIKQSSGSKIFCSDLNVLPETKSVSILGEGNKNLIKEYGVSNTRSSADSGYEQVVDYIITSPEVKINDFKVLTDEVSDHLPLFLDFE